MKKIFLAFFLTIALVSAAQASLPDLVKAVIHDKNLTLKNNEFGLALMDTLATEPITVGFRNLFDRSMSSMVLLQKSLNEFAIPTYVKKVGNDLQAFTAIFPRAYGIDDFSMLQVIVGQVKTGAQEGAISGGLAVKLKQLAETTNIPELKNSIEATLKRNYAGVADMKNGKTAEAIDLMVDIKNFDEATLTKMLDEVSQLVRTSAKLAE